MLQIEVATTTSGPVGIFRTKQLPFLSIELAGTHEDLERLQLQLNRIAESGESIKISAKLNGSDANLFLFRTSELLSAVVTDAGLVLFGNRESLEDLSCAAKICCSKDVADGFHKHFEFGAPNGLGPWPQGCLVISADRGSGS
jgi:hypothetical protein